MAEEALALFADLLDYPGPTLAEHARVCQALVAPEHPEAAALLRSFRAFVEERSLGELEEIYTGAFDLDTLSDLDATCYPYVGHHLFGESYKRSAFLVGLRERYRAHGFTVEVEMPDHLAVVLRFLASSPDEDLAAELVGEALVPALDRMLAGEGEEERGGRAAYLKVLRALRLVLEKRAPARAQLAAAGGAP